MRPLQLALVITSCMILAAIVVRPRPNSNSGRPPADQPSMHSPGASVRVASIPTAPTPSEPLRESPRPRCVDPTELTRRVDQLVAAKRLELGNVGNMFEPALVALSRDSGCFDTRYRMNLYSLPGTTRQDDELEVIAREEVDRIAGLLLASRPTGAETLEQTLLFPDHHLAQMGITPETFALHRADLLATFLDRRWYAPAPDPSQFLPELEEIFSFDLVRHDLISAFLAISSGSTRSRWHFVQIPGEPWIVAGTESETPDCLPWYVRVGNEGWYTQDRDLARALIELLSPDVDWDMQADWRERLWTERDYWWRSIRRVEEALGRARGTSARDR